MTEPYPDIPMALVLFGSAFVICIWFLSRHLLWRARSTAIQGQYQGWKDVSDLSNRSGGGFLYQRQISYTCPHTQQTIIHNDVMSDSATDWRHPADRVGLLLGPAPDHLIKSTRQWWVAFGFQLVLTLVSGTMAVAWWPNGV